MQYEQTRGATFEGDAPVAASDAAMPDRRELALVAVERTRMPMVVCDARQADSPIVLANQAFIDLTGYSATEILGRNCRFLQGPDTDPAALAQIRVGLAAHQDVDVELINYRKDGSAFWNQLAISPILDEHGALLYYFGPQKDVSARRRAQEMEHAERHLLMEVDHRAMNALALVQSFVRLGRTDTVEDYACTVQLRVDALARAHRLLARNGWASADLVDLIAMETPTEVSARVKGTGPSVHLAAQIVQPVTLMLHELMRNALGHGALSQPNGALEICWKADSDRIALRWKERGAELNQGSPVEGLGLGLVRGVIERQLGGKAVFDWADQGLVAAFDFAPGIDARRRFAIASGPAAN